MPILRITITGNAARLHRERRPLMPVLNRALRADQGPVTIMVHGFKYHPGHPVHCPHGPIPARPTKRAYRSVVNWPARLGMHGQPGGGLGLSLGWSARGSIWAARASAQAAGHTLAALISDIRGVDPDRKINLIAHSLGARVALTAIRAGAPGAVNRAILLAAAEYAEAARSALDSKGGAGTTILNVTSRENDLFDFLLERLIAPPRPGDRMLGHGGFCHPRLVTLQLDDSRSLLALRQAGFHIAPPERLICHWSPYLREGVFLLYRAVLDGSMPLETLRALLPTDCAPRWSRLRPRLPIPQPPLLPAE